MVMKQLAEIIGWICILGGIGLLGFVKEGFSKLEKSMGVFCLACLCFSFPTMTNILYTCDDGPPELAGSRRLDGTYEGDILFSAREDGEDVVYIHKQRPIIELIDYQKEFVLEEDKRETQYSYRYPSKDYWVIKWDDLDSDQQYDYKSRQEDYCKKYHPFPATEGSDVDKEDMDVSAWCALFIMGIVGGLMKFFHSIGIPYTFQAPFAWFCYFTNWLFT